MSNIKDTFACLVFNDKVMRERLDEATFAKLISARKGEEKLSLSAANKIADAMKNWAIENGATHYTHWFQPMTGVTAEKHDSFLDPDKDGNAIFSFSGKNLIKGESDASSFPSGGLRATFEARGYTAWDPSSYAFIKDGSLYIPTCFCSYDGSALDKKTPLLRSIEALNAQVIRILRLFGNDTAQNIVVNVGPEQEYFLIDKSVAEKRLDITVCGRTLFGAKPPKGQEMDDHYYGSINTRVSDYMKDLENELWKHGVFAKTKHNEVAPAQHELAPVFCDANLATDQNQLTMDYMKSIAQKHGMVCLLHEKPFKAINGSGKHNNWSISTDDGQNLFEPGNTPFENAQFLLFLTAALASVDDYQDLLRASVASPQNDLRLGGNEAPPAIISVFLGDELTAVIEAIIGGTNYVGGKTEALTIGVHSLPKINKDTTDRNRTSPFAFTGNKFEFRMVGSSASIAGPNIVLNTAMAETLSVFADKLETSKDFENDLNELIRETLKLHKRIVFNGNNYSLAWEREAKKRGLCNFRTTVDAVPSLITTKNIELFTKHSVYSKAELIGRCDILLENYYKVVSIEALTMLSMARSLILPAGLKFEKQLADLIIAKKAVAKSLVEVETSLIGKVSDIVAKINEHIDELENAIAAAPVDSGVYELSKHYRDAVIPIMDGLRSSADELENILPRDLRPFPTYTEILYSVK